MNEDSETGSHAASAGGVSDLTAGSTPVDTVAGQSVRRSEIAELDGAAGDGEAGEDKGADRTEVAEGSEIVEDSEAARVAEGGEVAEESQVAQDAEVAQNAEVAQDAEVAEESEANEDIDGLRDDHIRPEVAPEKRTAPELSGEPDGTRTSTAGEDADEIRALRPASAADEATSAGGGAGARRRRLVPITLAVLVVVSAAVVAPLGWRAYSDARDQRARDAALAAARAETSQVLSYDVNTLDSDLANSRKVISGDFAARFDELANSVIAPAARQHNIATKTTVTRAAVIDSQPGQVRALLFVNQATAMDGQAPRQASNQVKVTMTWTDTHWLISDLQPL